jgi:membrane associated rhomboid family serine protease
MAVACAAVTLHAHYAARGVLEEIDRGLAGAEAYFLDHPYLDNARIPVSVVPAAVAAKKRAQYHRAQQRRGAPPVPPRVVDREQEELDALVDQAFEALAGLPAQRLGLRPGAAAPRSFVSYALLHTGKWHLVGNLALLVLLAVYLEPGWGRMLFGPACVGLVAAGGLGWFLAGGAVDLPLVGTTPLLCGLLAAFAIHHGPDRGEGFYAALLVCGALWLALPFFAGVDLSIDPLTATLRKQVVPPRISLWACGAGLAAGLALAGVIRLFALDARVRAAERGGSAGASPLFERALRAHAAGRDEEAFEQLSALVRKQPDHVDGLLALWDVARDLGRRVEASAALVRAIREELKRGLTAAAVEHWLELTERGFPEEADAGLLVRMAAVLREGAQPGAALGALRCALERARGSANPVVASRVARAALELDPVTAEEAAWQALGSIDLDLEERQALETLLGRIVASPFDTPTQATTLTPARDAPMDDPFAPAGARSAPGVADAPAAPIEIDTVERRADVVAAVPVELDGDGVRISLGGGEKKRVRYERIEAVAVAAVHGLGPKPVLVVDLVLNWMTTTQETLRVIRLRGDRFDPRRLVRGIESPAQALRKGLEMVLERSNATPLPDRNAAIGRPFASFSDLATYQSTVLMVDGELGDEKETASRA